MTSINTNIAAMTALQTLQSTNQAMEATQNRISTGYRVGEAKDNAAYWSIATTMRSDNKAMSAVQDSLGIGAATVDTAYTALTSTKDVLDEIKAKLTTATQAGVDKAKVQGEITQLQEQLKSIASSASFSGQNWLSVDSSATGYNAVKDMVANFARDANGALSLGTISVDTSKVALYDSNADGEGILDAGKLGNTNTGGLKNGTNTSATAVAAAITMDAIVAGTNDVTQLDENDTITFKVALNGADAKTVTIDQKTVNEALTVTDGAIATDANFVTVINKALENAGFATSGTTADALIASVNASDQIVLTTGQTTLGSSVTVSEFAVSNGVGVSEIDITTDGITAEDIKSYISVVDNAIEKVTAGAADLGSTKNRIDMQTSFVSNLMDAIDRGVGTLVDADMTEESTKLKALQTQQQLGVQALSIANQSSQTLLSLFR